jgi:hypothetical protein
VVALAVAGVAIAEPSHREYSFEIKGVKGLSDGEHTVGKVHLPGQNLPVIAKVVVKKGMAVDLRVYDILGRSHSSEPGSLLIDRVSKEKCWVKKCWKVFGFKICIKVLCYELK